ncbi:Ig-like domain-containing protein [Deinococcus peraridilitoris]|uniref:F5/8 type C domain-containing protein n=1 Tax=Deinococcus peraridilitoris (strain DSM 19664 / LMG 22246 / CIP 109416 / KR-200) TaxID=937777 RepID=L0A185_DEIPD|nr:Ig-like domain-containing protein [Deinococcus peraridilitoris]AFZ67586.1 hypothetical protein Deipe_2091 [Deinococcus peraridilitoris DSM 19664]
MNHRTLSALVALFFVLTSFAGAARIPIVTVTASSAVRETPAYLTADNNPLTSWIARPASQWIRWDFGSVQNVASVDLALYNGRTQDSVFDLWVSTDAITWKQVLRRALAQPAKHPLDKDGFQRFTFLRESARYVLFVGYGSSRNNMVGVSEARFESAGTLIGAALPDFIPGNGVAGPVDLDVTPPSVTLAASKTSVTTANDSVELVANATDNRGVTKVEFYRNGTLYGTDTSAPFTSTLTYLSSAANGTYSYSVLAYDAAGNTRSSEVVTVVVNIPAADSSAPTVSLSATSTNVTAAGSVLLTATASDNKGVTKVEFYRDGVLAHTEQVAPYEHTETYSSDFSNGTYNFTARAYDADNNATTSGTVTVIVNIASSNVVPMGSTADTATVTQTANSPIPTVTGTTYYVDSVDGSDSNSGTSTGAPWKTVTKANAVTLLPGDALLFKAGSSYSSMLHAKWYGTSSNRILIGAYGNGAKPIFEFTGGEKGVLVTGAYLTIDNLLVRTAPSHYPAYDASPERCINDTAGTSYWAQTANGGNGQPYDFRQRTGWRVGINISAEDYANNANSGRFNVIQNSRTEYTTAGIHLSGANSSGRPATSNNQVIATAITKSIFASVNTPVGVKYDDDSGGFGLLINGHNNIAAYNYFEGNITNCSEDYRIEGGDLEIFSARNNFMHHNTSINSGTFTELGGSTNNRAERNVTRTTCTR